MHRPDTFQCFPSWTCPQVQHFHLTTVSFLNTLPSFKFLSNFLYPIPCYCSTSAIDKFLDILKNNNSPNTSSSSALFCFLPEFNDFYFHLYSFNLLFSSSSFLNSTMLPIIPTRKAIGQIIMARIKKMGSSPVPILSQKSAPKK